MITGRLLTTVAAGGRANSLAGLVSHDSSTSEDSVIASEQACLCALLRSHAAAYVRRAPTRDSWHIGCYS